MSGELAGDSQGKMVVFGGKRIRRAWVDDQWYFSVVDVIGALTDSDAPSKYWTAMKRREEKTSGFQLSTICRKLKLTSSDGKTYGTDCVNTEAAFRIIQSIPSPKAEPFKQWLASVGYQRVQEIENPELAQQRMRELYKEKGYPDDWIEKRVRGIAVRHKDKRKTTTKHTHGGPSPDTASASPFWRSLSLDELAERQGVSVVSDLDEISALWPVDDDPDELLEYVLHERQARGTLDDGDNRT